MKRKQGQHPPGHKWRVLGKFAGKRRPLPKAAERTERLVDFLVRERSK